MQRAIIALTVLLVLVGGVLFFSGSEDTALDFVDWKAYEVYRLDDGVATEAPTLPLCATAIAVVVSEGMVTTVGFNCTEVALRAAFLKEIETKFDWNISVFADDRISLARVIKKDI
jgi:hypothetical protein